MKYRRVLTLDTVLVHQVCDWKSSAGSAAGGLARRWGGGKVESHLTSQQRREAPAPPQPEGHLRILARCPAAAHARQHKEMQPLRYSSLSRRDGL
jgi:hypothetical protein